MEIKVGNRYAWQEDETIEADMFTITTIDGDIVYYIYGDGVKAEDSLSSGWFDDAILVTDKEVKSAITPSHYNSTKIDALSVIDDWQLSFRLGNTIKYIQRHLHKGKPIEDLEKAYQYLGLEIKRLKDNK